MRKAIKDIVRMWVAEDGTPEFLIIENGADTIYKVTRASKQDKDDLFETENVE